MPKLNRPREASRITVLPGALMAKAEKNAPTPKGIVATRKSGLKKDITWPALRIYASASSAQAPRPHSKRACVIFNDTFLTLIHIPITMKTKPKVGPSLPKWDKIGCE